MHKIYYIYHIPTYKRKNGKIGKIGCTEEVDAKARVERQGYTDYEVLETHTDIYEASKREKELQKQYGYPVDRTPYYHSRSKWGSVAGKKGGKIGGKIVGKKHAESGHMTRMAKLAGKKAAESGQIQALGKIQGKKNVESGHWAKIASLGGKIGGKINGKIQGKKNVESGQWARVSRIAYEKRKRPVLQFTKDGQFVNEWECGKYAGVELGISSSAITQCCKGKLYKSVGGYVWKYKEE